MERIDLAKMRKKQLIFLNTAILVAMSIYMLLISITKLSNSDMNLLLGIFMLSLSIVSFSKKDPTKSWIPIVEQVAKYEKSKMGREWTRQYRIGYICNFLLGVMF
ncbi:hypothetical protein LG329_14385 [Virgibacillus necropolis]|uniref:hypothetical protein n=1 Tax=Virgibacillus necropolis TaxID=163877 RepID=UPI00384CBD17